MEFASKNRENQVQLSNLRQLINENTQSAELPRLLRDTDFKIEWDDLLLLAKRCDKFTEGKGRVTTGCRDFPFLQNKNSELRDGWYDPDSEVYLVAAFNEVRKTRKIPDEARDLFFDLFDAVNDVTSTHKAFHNRYPRLYRRGT